MGRVCGWPLNGKEAGLWQPKACVSAAADTDVAILAAPSTSRTVPPRRCRLVCRFSGLLTETPCHHWTTCLSLHPAACQSLLRSVPAPRPGHLQAGLPKLPLPRRSPPRTARRQLAFPSLGPLRGGSSTESPPSTALPSVETRLLWLQPRPPRLLQACKPWEAPQRWLPGPHAHNFHSGYRRQHPAQLARLLQESTDNRPNSGHFAFGRLDS